jgi:O-antigen/teichoic acid export membrane protein
MTATGDTDTAIAPAAGSYDRRRTLFNFIAMSGSGALSLVVGILTSVYVRRVLGPGAIGQVTWNLAVLAYLSLFVANPGLQTIGQREIAKHPGSTAAIASSVVGAGFLIALAMYAVVVAIALVEPRGPEVSMLLIWQGVCLIPLAFNLDWVLRAHERMIAPSIASFAVNLLQLPILLALVHGPGDVLTFAVCGVPLSCLAAIGMAVYAHRLGVLRLDRLRPSLAGAGTLIRESWPVILSQAAVLVYWNSGTVILGFTHGDEAVGLYGTATRMIFMTTVVSGGLMNAYLPVLARVHNEPAQAAEVAGEFTAALVWMGLPLAGLGWLAGGRVVDLLFGPEFHEAGRYFEWLCLSIALSFANVALRAPLVSWGYQRTELRINATGAAINLAISLALIPVYGAWGAVAGVIGAELAVLVMQTAARRRIGHGWHRIMPVLMLPFESGAGAPLAAVRAAIRRRG